MKREVTGKKPGRMVELERYLEARRRPEGRVVLHMSWRHLTFLHFTLDPGVVQATLPQGLTVDTFPDESGKERAWVGIVPFTMHRIRPARLPWLPWLSAFHETNLRTYVHCEGRDPGVWFYSLDAARWLACMIARISLGLPYRHAYMSLTVSGDQFHYRSVRRERPLPGELLLEAAIGEPLRADPGSLEFWLVERYRLFSILRGQLVEAAVHHQPYSLRQATVKRVETTLHQPAGLPLTPWSHVCYSPGVDVEVMAPVRLPKSKRTTPAVIPPGIS